MKLISFSSHPVAMNKNNTETSLFSLPQHVVFVVKFFLAWLIPDVPVDIKARITRERYLIQEYLNSYELGKLTMQLSASLVGEPPPEATQERAAGHLREFTEPEGQQDERMDEEQEEEAELTSTSTEATEHTESTPPMEGVGESVETPELGEGMTDSTELDEEAELAAVMEDEKVTEFMMQLGLDSATDLMELTDLTEAVEATEATEATEGDEIIEVTEETEDGEIVEGTVATESTEIVEDTVAMEGTENMDVTEAPEDTQIVEITVATEGTEITEGTVATEDTEDEDISDVRIE